MKKIVIAFSILLMLSGGAVSVMKWMEIGPFEPVDERALTEENAATTDEATIDIPLDPLIIPVFSGDQVVATVMIGVKLQVIGSDNEEAVTKILPRLSDGFLRDLYSFIPRVIRKQRKLNAAILGERMKLIADKVAGPDLVHKIVVESMTEQ
ncbi:MAG: hypothetical protein ACTSV1_00600 [Alphaproteobacteria bacterium]